MSRFRFPLQTLLDHRLHAEREKKIVVAQIERERADVEDQIRGVQSSIESMKHEMRSVLKGATTDAADSTRLVSLRSARLQAGASLHHQFRAQRAAIQLAGIHERLGAARAELSKAMSERRAIELLKEKQFEQWKLNQKRKEAAELDELSTMRAARTEKGFFDAS